MEEITSAYIDCVIPGIPKPMPRMKPFYKNGKMWKYPPKGIEEYKSKVRCEISHAILQVDRDKSQTVEGELNGRIEKILPWPYGIRMTLHFIFPRPQNKIWKKKPMPRYNMLKRPDCDNLAKAIMDSLNQYLYKDDSQVYYLSVTKEIGDANDAARTEISILLTKEIE